MTFDCLKMAAHYGRMAGKESTRGPTAETVAANVTRIRESQNLNYTQLSERLVNVGRPISAVGVRRIESGERRVDADDLVALAAALGVSPITLLMPVTESANDRVSILNREVSARALFDWLRARRASIPEFTGSHFEFLSRSLPGWALEMLERDALEMIARERQQMEAWLSEDADDGDD